MKGYVFVSIFCVNYVYLLWITEYVRGAELSNFIMEESYLCPDITIQKLTCFIRPRNFNPGLQLVDVNMTVPVPLGNDVIAKLVFDVDAHLANKHSWVHLLDIEDEFCKLLSRYIGEFWYDIQTGLGIMAHSCPVPRGNYHAVNYLMNYNKIKIQSLPLGKLRIRVHVSHKTRSDVQGCFIVIASMH